MSETDEARLSIRLLLLAGLAALIGGVVLAGAQWPRVDAMGAEDGSRGAAILGLVVAAVGSAAMFVALIAYGVHLGLALRANMGAAAPATDASRPLGARQPRTPKSLGDVQSLD